MEITKLSWTPRDLVYIISTWIRNHQHNYCQISKFNLCCYHWKDWEESGRFKPLQGPSPSLSMALQLPKPLPAEEAVMHTKASNHSNWRDRLNSMDHRPTLNSTQLNVTYSSYHSPCTTLARKLANQKWLTMHQFWILPPKRCFNIYPCFISDPCLTQV